MTHKCCGHCGPGPDDHATHRDPPYTPECYWEKAYWEIVPKLAALAAPSTPEPIHGPNPCIVCGQPARAVVTVCGDHMYPALLADPTVAAMQRNDMGRVIALALASQGYAATDSEAVGLALLREIEEGGYTLRLTTNAERRARMEPRG